MVRFQKFSHVSIVVSNLAKAKKFYGQVLGLKPIFRPEFDFPGAWYTFGKIDLHIIVNPKRTHRWSLPTSLQVCYPHFALFVKDADKIYAQLIKSKIAVQDFVSTPTGFRQLFLYDPDGNMVELMGPTKLARKPSQKKRTKK